MNYQTLKLEIKGGLNYANITGTSIQTDAITSYHTGLLGVIKTNNKFAVQREASHENATQEFKNKLGYLSLPVFVKIGLSKSLSLQLGPQASFLLSKKTNSI